MDYMESIDFFIKDALDSSSEQESGASSGLMVPKGSLIHEHTEIQRLMHKGSMRHHRVNMKWDQEGGHY
jgi:uncharacterized protein (DUF1919 family)